MENQTEQAAPEQSQSTPAQPVDIKQAKPKKSMLMFAGIALILVAIAAGAYFLFTGGDDDTTETVQETMQTDEAGSQSLQAAVTLVEGNVQFSSDAKSWTDAVGGETVGEGDYVRTLTDSRTVVLLDDGSAIRLDAASYIQLASSNTQYVEIKLLGGQVYTRVVEDSSRVFSVATENDSYEAQGTAYTTSAIEGKDKVEVYQSQIKVKSSGELVDEGKSYDSDEKTVGDIDEDSLKTNEFAQWNKEQDVNSGVDEAKLGFLGEKVEEPKQVETTPEPKPAPTPAPAPDTTPSGITLSGNAVDGGVKLTWSMNGVSTKDGFKIVRDKSDSTPTYGVNSSTYVGNNSTRSYTLDLKDGKSYYFRVCVYDGDCSNYSNSVRVTAPFAPIEEVQAGTVTLSYDEANNKASWTFTGTAPHGFKVVHSTATGPTYPANSIAYTGSTSKVLPSEPGTYYVRVCKYTASDAYGGCTDYSNEITYTID
ncbi:MAG: FecR domain-containing protein [Patescibacteria group bacterium]